MKYYSFVVLRFFIKVISNIFFLEYKKEPNPYCKICFGVGTHVSYLSQDKSILYSRSVQRKICSCWR
jgi:hypothetical protein